MTVQLVEDPSQRELRCLPPEAALAGLRQQHEADVDGERCRRFREVDESDGLMRVEAVCQGLFQETDWGVRISFARLRIDDMLDDEE